MLLSALSRNAVLMDVLYVSLRRHDVKDFKTLRLDQRDAAPQKFPIAKPSSDNSSAFIKFAKKEFGKDAAIQQCGVHFTGNLLAYFLFCS
jgi:hypothetical protein